MEVENETAMIERSSADTIVSSPLEPGSPHVLPTKTSDRTDQDPKESCTIAHINWISERLFQKKFHCLFCRTNWVQKCDFSFLPSCPAMKDRNAIHLSCFTRKSIMLNRDIGLAFSHHFNVSESPFHLDFCNNLNPRKQTLFSFSPRG
jgi:hypothetical protein